jgi:hypothetical protein
MFRQVLCQIFSHRCLLTSLQLDIRKSFYSIHQCLKTIPDRFESYCTTLRRLHIRLDYTCFLEDLIDYVPNLEQISVHFRSLKRDNELYDSNIQSLLLPNGNWFNKVR